MRFFCISLCPRYTEKDKDMTFDNRFGESDDYRREELLRAIEHSIKNLTLQELEALYYDMSTKNYINESRL